MKNEILRLERVTQHEHGLVRLDNVSMHIFQGEIMGLLCINQHGQEALVKLLCHNLPIHYGSVYFQESLVNHYAHSTLRKNRVSVIERTSRLVEDLTVADNIFVLRPGFKKYLINPKVLDAQLRRFTEDLGVVLEGGQLVSQLTFFEKCVVELLRSIVAGIKLIVIRDVSNFISAADLVRFHRLIRHCTGKGMSFLYICNHHEEAFQICTRISMMRDGKILKVLTRDDFRDELVLHYAKERYMRPAADSGVTPPRQELISFDGVSVGEISDLRFTVGKGECIVLLDMNNTLPNALFSLLSGRQALEGGEIRMEELRWSAHARRMEVQMCFLDENPTRTALYDSMSYLENLCFWLDRKFPALWRKPRVRKSVEKEYFPVVGDDIWQSNISRLSLFARYSLVYYKVALYHPKILFCVQPFSGADLYLRRHILERIDFLKSQGIAVVILAVSLSDSLEVADRLLVTAGGRLVKEYTAEHFYALHMEKGGTFLGK